MIDFEELHEYRLMEVNEAVGFIRTMFNNNFNPDYIKGAMDMLKKIIRLPETMARTKEQKNNANVLSTRLLEEFEKKIIRRMLEEA